MDNRKGVWIPIGLYSRNDLSVLEMILLTEIDSLDNSEKGCFASNIHFSKLLKLSEGRTANMISDLKKREFIYYTFFDGRNRGLRVSDEIKASLNCESRVHENVKQDNKNVKQVHEYVKQDNESVKAGSQNREHINTFNDSLKSSLTKNKGNDFVVPYEFVEFTEIWNTWSKYRKEEHKFSYKSASTELISFNYLVEISKGNVETAIKCINSAIAGGYKKPFPLKEEKKQYDQPVVDYWANERRKDEAKARAQDEFMETLTITM